MGRHPRHGSNMGIPLPEASDGHHKSRAVEGCADLVVDHIDPTGLLGRTAAADGGACGRGGMAYRYASASLSLSNN
jgi:hypothetical protein